MALFEINCVTSDPHYLNLKNSSHHAAVAARYLCENLWEDFAEYADPDFISEFAATIYTRFWEMDLTCLLKNKGYSIECPKPGPDVCIVNDDSRIWIEAVCPTNGLNANAVPDEVNDGFSVLPDEQIILRLTTSINAKHDAYKRYIRNNTIDTNQPYVIAVNGCRINSSRDELSCPRIVRSVFPVGDQFITFNTETRDVLGIDYRYSPSVPNSNGIEISTDIFLDSEYSGISAVIFSNSTFINRPVIDGSDFIVVHNPNATNPIEGGLFNFGTEYIPEPEQNNALTLTRVVHQ
jgi:type I restriction enzyme S subunit